MRKVLIFLIPTLCYSSPLIDKIIYNGKENSNAILISSNLKTNTPLNVTEIDTLVDNFKFAKNNNINVNIEPSKEEGKVNLIVTNTKTNPFSFSFGIDNYGANEEEGKYRHTIELESNGVILNEKLNISYTFVTPIEPKRDKVEDLLPGEIIDTTKPENLTKARKNNKLTAELSFPINNFRTYLTYSGNEYKSSIIANKNIYDVSGNSNRYGLKLKVILGRTKNSKFNISSGYAYTSRTSYIEDAFLSRDSIHEVNLGAEYSYKKFSIENIYNHRIEKGSNTPSFDTKFNLNKGGRLAFGIVNHIEKNNNNLQASIDAQHNGIYSKIGINTDFNKTNPDLKLGLKKNLGIFYLDTSLNYTTEFKWLFNMKVNI